ncbi:hypothetical protein FQA47_014223 [Oryzias melastigma]|uniref:Uncharacterized protein n=1 Tax=Oryzias melastigma TaxID=30732 RepID=A0A834F2D3_ORYME|nr:hypothetical protein FQA47_014223 [Oryzias melastigma]
MSVQLSPRLTLITVFLRCSAQVSLESGASISFYSLSFILISSVEALHHQTLKDKLLLCAEFHQSKHELIRVSKVRRKTSSFVLKTELLLQDHFFCLGFVKVLNDAGKTTFMQLEDASKPKRDHLETRF